jgi:hypothetical protein
MHGCNYNQILIYIWCYISYLGDVIVIITATMITTIKVTIVIIVITVLVRNNW